MLWGDPAYLSLARQVVDNIVQKLIQPAPVILEPVLMPGAEGFSTKERPDGPVVNLSYWIFPAFYWLAQALPSYDWRAVHQSGLNLIDRARFGQSGLPSDWLSIAYGGISPALGYGERFGYDALRIPLYLFWADAAPPSRLRVFEEAWRSGTSIIGLRAGLDPDRALEEPGYQAIGALVRCGAKGSPYPEGFYRFTERQNYFPATLHLLSIVAAAIRGGPCLDPARMSEILSSRWKPRTGSLVKIAAALDQELASRNKLKEVSVTSVPWMTEPREIGLMETLDGYDYLRGFAGAAMVLLGIGCLLKGNEIEEPCNEPEIESPADHGLVFRSIGNYAPRTLLRNPFTQSRDIETLGREIEAAATASIRRGRTLGLAVIELPVNSIKQASEQDQAEALVGFIAGELRRILRSADHVAVLDSREILICVCLLEGRNDLERVASRLSAVVRRLAEIPDEAPPLPVGFAIYPLDGYSGQELIAAARRSY